MSLLNRPGLTVVDGARVLHVPIARVEKKENGREDITLVLIEGLRIELFAYGKTVGASFFVDDHAGAEAISAIAVLLGMPPAAISPKRVVLGMSITEGRVETARGERLAAHITWDVGAPEGGGAVHFDVDVPKQALSVRELRPRSLEALVRQWSGVAPETPRQRGFRLNQKKDLHGAYAAFAHALELDAEDAIAWIERGKVARALHDDEAAVGAWTSALAVAESDESRRQALRLRATACEGMGRLEEAIADVALLIDNGLDPGGAPRVWRARLLIAAGRPQDALVDLDDALAGPTGGAAAAHELRAEALGLLGRAEEAAAARAAASQASAAQGQLGGMLEPAGARKPR